MKWLKTNVRIEKIQWNFYTQVREGILNNFVTKLSWDFKRPTNASSSECPKKQRQAYWTAISYLITDVAVNVGQPPHRWKKNLKRAVCDSHENTKQILYGKQAIIVCIYLKLTVIFLHGFLSTIFSRLRPLFLIWCFTLLFADFLNFSYFIVSVFPHCPFQTDFLWLSHLLSSVRVFLEMIETKKTGF